MIYSGLLLRDQRAKTLKYKLTIIIFVSSLLVSACTSKSPQISLEMDQFDSDTHGPELKGELFRDIFIASNDPQTPETRIEFGANIIRRP